VSNCLAVLEVGLVYEERLVTNLEIDGNAVNNVEWDLVVM
jgi:hypothetical protein